MENKISPVFIFSMPRSGSTLLQRVLGAHSRIATRSETWLLLPLIYMLKDEGVYSIYNHKIANQGITEFIGSLEGGEDEFRKKVNEFVLGIYKKACGEKHLYFVDKTPRYNIICEEIISMFPNAKFIFLWRNPLSIISSIIETWGIKNHWNLHASKVDLFMGYENLINGYERNKDKALSIKFEDLVSNSSYTIKKIFDYLELDFEEGVLETFPDVSMNGSLGDPTGINDYNKISRDPIEKWKKTIINPFRVRWATNYIKWLGKKRLRSIGYDYNFILKELKSSKFTPKFLAIDSIKIMYGFLYNWAEINIHIEKIAGKKKYTFGHR